MGENKFNVNETGEFVEIENENGAFLKMKKADILVEDGFAFKNLAKDKKLLPYEDWRLDAVTRAKDLAGRLSIDEIAGLMLYSSHQMVPFRSSDHFKGHYKGREYGEEMIPWQLTDEQNEFLEKENIRHVLLMRVDNADVAARWNNQLQELAESLPWGIPVNISSDPRHGASDAGAEFKSASVNFSKWPEGIGMSATFSPELCKKFAKIVAKEYRALGICTALGPQIDLATEPRWMRQEDTFGGNQELAIKMTKAYCDGLQTTENSQDGWGEESVVAMVKHWPSGATGEGGRDAHYPFGKFAVYPGNNFEQHKEVFTKGAFHLDGPTKMAGAVMPYYTVSWDMDQKNGENVGNSYNEYLIKDLLREENKYEGVVCTDWGITQDPESTIDSFSSRCYGVENLSEAERHLKIIMNGVDQFGGNNRKEPLLEAYTIGCDKYGEKIMRKRMEESAVRLLTNIFRVGLFENPYLDPANSTKVVGSKEHIDAGLDAQKKSIVMIKNKNQVLPLKKGIKVYIPDRFIRARKNFFRKIQEESRIVPLQAKEAEEYFTLVKSPEEADAAIVFMESPLTDGYLEGEGYLPISLKYRPYTATAARKTSIAGGDFREEDSNRAYYGKSNCAYNEADLNNVLETKKRMPGKPVIACIRMHNPMVVSEFEAEVDGVLVEFGVEKRALLSILFGEEKPSGRLPVIMPKDMDTVERHNEDVFDDIEAYQDEMGNQYGFGFGLN